MCQRNMIMWRNITLQNTVRASKHRQTTSETVIYSESHCLIHDVTLDAMTIQKIGIQYLWYADSSS